MADTGLSVDSCFFFDPQSSVTMADTVTHNVTGIPVIAPARHRKLVQYYGYQSESRNVVYERLSCRRYAVHIVNDSL